MKIKHGTIQQFSQGVHLVGATKNKLDHLTVTQTHRGIELENASNANKIEHNKAIAQLRRDPSRRLGREQGRPQRRVLEHRVGDRPDHRQRQQQGRAQQGARQRDLGHHAGRVEQQHLPAQQAREERHCGLRAVQLDRPPLRAQRPEAEPHRHRAVQRRRELHHRQQDPEEHARRDPQLHRARRATSSRRTTRTGTAPTASTSSTPVTRSRRITPTRTRTSASSPRRGTSTAAATTRRRTATRRSAWASPATDARLSRQRSGEGPSPQRALPGMTGNERKLSQSQPHAGQASPPCASRGSSQ